MSILSFFRRRQHSGESGGGPERAGSTNQDEFRPFDGECILLKPFLNAPESTFADVKQAVRDSGIAPERANQLMEWYVKERAKVLAERGEKL